MWVESEMGEGTTFHFTIALSPGQEDAPAWRHSPPSMHGTRVLVIDDNRAQRRMLAALTALWKLDAREADSLQAAERVLKAEGPPFALLLVDRDLLGAAPEEALTRLRGLPGAAGARVLLRTSRRVRVADALAIGADGRVVSPVRPAALLEAVVSLLGPADTGAQAPATPSPAEAPIALRILLADDNIVNRKVGVGLLARLGYAAHVVTNGAEVLAALDAHVYDVILLDIHMPEVDGFEAARRIRARWAGDDAHRPMLIAMTAGALAGDRERCLEAGMDDYISKPIEIDKLQAALARAIATS